MDFVDAVNIAGLADKMFVFLINAVGLELILWLYIASRRVFLGRLLLYGSFCFLLWFNLDFIATQAVELFSLSAATTLVLWSFRAMYALLAVFFALFYVFCLNFPAANPLNGRQRQKRRAAAAAGSFFAAASLSSMVVEGAVFDANFPVFSWIIPGGLFWFYCGAALLALFFSFRELSRNRRLADAQNRQKLKLAAVAGGFFGVFNLIFNVIMPGIGPISGYVGFFALFANHAIVALLGYAVYLAARDNLSGIKIILVEIFVGLMGASLVVMPFFVDFLWQKTLLILLFLLFCVFGYLLIKSAVKEYREKEMLEQKVVERTKELELAKNDLEETNLMLEARVRSRTKELEQLNETLEEKIDSRTKDLKEKIKDLETFQRITVGRELKMIELKKEIERLRFAAGFERARKSV